MTGCGHDTDLNEVGPDDTRWVRFWRSFRSGRNAETYQRLSYHGTSDEDYLHDEALRWAEDQGPRGYDFRYGWEVVDCPPKKWLLDDIDRLTAMIDACASERNALIGLVADMEDES
jgi:hypothetical protein